MTVGQGMIFGLVFLVGLGTLGSVTSLIVGRMFYKSVSRTLTVLILMIPVYLFLVWAIIALGLLASGA